MKAEKQSVSLEVYDPSGTLEVTARHAQRLAGLSGKTICELSNLTWEDFRTFPLIRRLLKEQYPDVNIVPFTEFPGVFGIEPDIISKMLKEKGCDAVILGNAG